MYENMRVRVENVVQEGTISRDDMTNEGESEAFSRWTDEFTPQNHPPVVQVCFPTLARVLIDYRGLGHKTYKVPYIHSLSSYIHSLSST